MKEKFTTTVTHIIDEKRFGSRFILLKAQVIPDSKIKDHDRPTWMGKKPWWQK